MKRFRWRERVGEALRMLVRGGALTAEQGAAAVAKAQDMTFLEFLKWFLEEYGDELLAILLQLLFSL